MADIKATDVKALREETGLGMMDCKKALQEVDGDLDAARDLLRTKGLATAEKKSGRTTSEGLVAIKTDDDEKTVTMVMVNCETDFASRNDEFRAMVANLVELADKCPAGKIDPTDEMSDVVQETLVKVGENMQYSGGQKITAEKVGSYLHHNGKVGVIVGLGGDVDAETITGLCQHIAFSDPMGISKDDIPSDIVAKEKEIAKQQAIESGKPAEIAEKMVEGKIRKFLAANALLEQPYVKDDKKKISEILGGVEITAFVRLSVSG